MFERFYKPDQNFLYLLVSQTITDQQVSEHVLAYDKEAQHMRGVQELVDVTRVDDLSTLTLQGSVQSVKLEENQPRTMGSRCAFLAQTEMQFGMARMYASIFSNTREEVNVFYDLNEALAWLYPDNDKAELIAFIEANRPSHD